MLLIKVILEHNLEIDVANGQIKDEHAKKATRWSSFKSSHDILLPTLEVSVTSHPSRTNVPS